MKLATEAPINGGRNYDGPKVEFSALQSGDRLVSTLLYAGTSEYPTVLTAFVVELVQLERRSKNPFGADNQQETISLVVIITTNIDGILRD